MRSRRQERRRSIEVISSLNPVNRARICLDGADGREALPSYIVGIDSILAWCRANGTLRDVSRIFGANSVVFTTPPHGTFYVELESRGRLLEMVINGRDLYVKGFRSPNGSFEIKSDIKASSYMIGEHVRTVVMKSNYGKLIPEGDVGYAKMGIYEFRRAFDTLYDYRGESPGKIAESIAIIAVNISEATRLQGAFDIVCRSFVDPNVSRLHSGTFDTKWVNRYGHYCREGMIQIDQRMSGVVPEAIKIRDIKVESVDEIWRQIRVFNYDAYDEGIFAHGSNPKPKVFREQPGPSQGKGAAAAPLYGKNGRPPRRKYTTSASSSSPQELDEWRDCMERNSRASNLQTTARRWQGGFSSLNPMSAEVSDWLTHFPALRKLCKHSYDTSKHRRTDTIASAQYNFQLLTFPRLKCKGKPLSLWRSWLPTLGQKIRQTQDMETGHATKQLKTGFVTLENKSKLSLKAPIERVGSWMSRVVRVLRR